MLKYFKSAVPVIQSYVDKQIINELNNLRPIQKNLSRREQKSTWAQYIFNRSTKKVMAEVKFYIPVPCTDFFWR